MVEVAERVRRDEERQLHAEHVRGRHHRAHQRDRHDPDPAAEARFADAGDQDRRADRDIVNPGLDTRRDLRPEAHRRR